MTGTIRLGILSDIHYAGPAERARGNDYELRVVPNALLRRCVLLYRRFFWMNRPLHQNYLLDRFLEQSSQFDYVVANGDFSCDTGFIGLSDEAVFQTDLPLFQSKPSAMVCQRKAFYSRPFRGLVSRRLLGFLRDNIGGLSFGSASRT